MVSGAGTGPARVPPSTARSAKRHLVRRRRRRLVPLLLLLVLLLAGALVAWQVSGPARGRATSAGKHPFRTTPTTEPPQTTKPTTTTVPPPPYEPPAIQPKISPPMPGEGQWVEMDKWDPGPPSILTTTFRPDPTQPSIVAYVAWMRTTTTQFALYLGYEGPGPTPLNRGPEMVPQSAWPRLLATFNSGFYEADSAAGFYTHGTLYFPMIKGLATVVAYTSGRVDIVDWQGGSRPGPGIVMARQNLPLLVNSGAATPGSTVWTNWGLTLGGVPAVWRTGLGIDAEGNLIYVAAADQTPVSLAQILVDVGAVRAMQLDINPEWPIFVTYGGQNAVSPSIFVPNPNSIPARFLSPATKDFFAVYRRLPGVTQQPW
ncbi:MAG: hypothetical protein ABSD78_10425 [Acidimicrobiales bacterium]|jgi:hypothetical protein